MSVKYINVTLFAQIVGVRIKDIREYERLGYIESVKDGYEKGKYDPTVMLPRLESNGIRILNEYHYGYVYMTTNLINGMKYIGQRTYPILDTSYFGSGKYLRRALKKYGTDNFKCEVLEWAENRDELNELEIKWIEFYHADQDENFYNISHGGNVPDMRGKNNPRYGAVVSDETRAKISESRKGKKISDYQVERIKEANSGRVFTEEHRRKIGDAQRGEKHWNYGNHLSEETKQKLREKNKGRKNPKCAVAKGKIWINDGVSERYIPEEESIPSEWVRGRLPRSKGPLHGKVMVNDGVKNQYVDEKDVDEYLRKGYKLGRK